MLDFDGNERASVHLRDADFNLLHILLQQLQRSDLRAEVRKARPTRSSRHRTTAPDWQRESGRTEQGARRLNVAIEQQRKLWQSQPKKFTKEQQDAGLDDAAKRIYVQLDRWQASKRSTPITRRR
jgi:hypothetical protein